MLKEIKNLYYHFKNISINKIPNVINLNANDICNSKCTMCNIWKNKREHEITPLELSKILKDPLFKEIRHVGITGGEPTLREDLPQLYQTCIENLPKLRGLSIITNAINYKQVIGRITEVNNICKKNNVLFSIMVSLDGVSNIHDKIRGREGNFKSSIEVINHFSKKENIPLSIGCTISKDNVWEVDELLSFLQDNNIYGRFRVAEFINRLYNQNRKEVIRNFTYDESYHLALFFKKLEVVYEKDTNIINTYKSIRNILLGGKRIINCPYQSNGVVLNSQGELSYCAPKSKILGNSLKKSSHKLYFKNLNYRKKIIKTYCNDCIHDYHSSPTLALLLSDLRESFYKKLINIYHPNRSIIFSFLMSKKRKKEKHILIVGWYGTETVGDKAILGGIINYYLNQNNKIKFIIASIYPYITEKTVDELSLQADIKIISVYSRDFIKYSKESDEVVMGGGPLMDLEELGIPLTAFKIAKFFGKKTTILGCGIGPLTKAKYQSVVKCIVKLSDEIKLRDSHSCNAIKNYNIKNKNIKLSGDFAKPYIKSIEHKIEYQNKNEIACFLREWTYEYYNHVNPEEFKIKKKNFEIGLSKYIKQKADDLKVDKICFYSMHNYIIGNDDRDFARKFIKQYFPDDNRVCYDKCLSTINSVIANLKSSRLNICMRFHSILFANELNTKFVAIDYTNNGKIFNYLKDNDKLEKIITIDSLCNL